MEKIPGHMIYQEKSTPGREINIDQVMESVKYDISKIFEKIRPSIDSHEFGIVLGIDGGGRVPALIVGKTMNQVYDSRGEEHVETLFLAGSRNLKDDECLRKTAETKQFFEQDKFHAIKSEGKKILIVEDVIATGRSIVPITESLSDLGIGYEIVALEFDDSKTANPTSDPVIGVQQIEKRLGAEIVYGQYGDVSPLYGKKQMAGVHKNADELFSRPLREELPRKNRHLNIPIPTGIVLEKPEQDIDVLRHTRDLVARISSELAKEYIDEA